VSFGLRGGAEDAEDSIEIVIKRHIVISETLPEKGRCEIEESSFVSLAIGILEFVSARVGVPMQSDDDGAFGITLRKQSPSH
jgi:hypothetical protein